MPKVSICVPNLNTRPFLPERFATIFAQTFQDWELIVGDSHSDDGSWEYIQALAAREPRMRISQIPRKGIYAGFNDCINLARGEYVCIATSDDTMSPDFLEKMVAALEAHPECGLAHCCATFIDETGAPTSWKWETWPHVKFFGETIRASHIRPPGHDTVLAFALHTPYFSITQLLIRRSLFEKAGCFESRWGSYGDLEWQMRATLHTATVHIPEPLATWRMHPQQATQLDRYYAAKRDGWYVQMADKVIELSRKIKVPGARGLPTRLRRFARLEQMRQIWSQLPGRSYKLRYLVKNLFFEPRSVGWFLREHFKPGANDPARLEQKIRAELAALKIPRPTILKNC